MSAGVRTGGRRARGAAWGLGAAAALAAAARAQPTSVVNGPHNLSASGPGAVRALTEDEVCVFCHAPHNSSPVKPLWNRAMPAEAYTIYGSRALQAQPGQPTGVSKMCLSCHDGTIALGSVVSRDAPIAMAGGVTTMPEGRGRLGTDLSDDHPVSFRYDAGLASRNPKLRPPGGLPPGVRLDGNGELQCTTCHDAHSDALGKFLVTRNERSQLCASCHQMGQTSVAAHQDCAACHQPHTAPSGPYLLRRATVTETCDACHDGTVAGAANVKAELSKLSNHDTGSPVDPPGPRQEHAGCADCHEPHTMQRGGAAAPGVPANLGLIDGVSLSGAPVRVAAAEHEVCFKCHAEGAAGRPAVTRKAEEHNARLEFAPSGISYHPVAAPGRGTDVPSLLPGWTTASRVACADCHASDGGRAAGGSGPGGVHGSAQAPLLALRYETQDRTAESAQAYALCYKCHDRASILGDRSFRGHRKHVVDERTPCAACHDAHGISSRVGSASGNTHLINFATGIVRANRQGRMEFADLGSRSGSCSLTCHGEEHVNKRYP